MAMTDKQGGSDLRANSTRAQRTADDTYLLTGHKWFTSAPMNDIFLVLAQAPDGLSCFIVPRVLDDGTHNTFRIQRLKDKLGNRSNASAEIELEDTIGWRLGDEGRGVATIIEMVAATRLDCALGSAAFMRRASVEASWHCSQRGARSLLVDQRDDVGARGSLLGVRGGNTAGDASRAHIRRKQRRSRAALPAFCFRWPSSG